MFDIYFSNVTFFLESEIHTLIYMLSFNFNLPLYHILKGIIMPHTLKKQTHKQSRTKLTTKSSMYGSKSKSIQLDSLSPLPFIYKSPLIPTK